MSFSKEGMTKENVFKELKSLKNQDARWDEGRTFSLIYNAGNDVNDIISKAYDLFLQSNALSISAFPSLSKLEAEVLEMTAHMLNGSKAVGNLCSGGTESICMAIKSAREWAKTNKPEIKEPEIVIPISAHPAFHKAGHYFSVKVISAPLTEDFKVDLNAMEQLISPNTIALVGSAVGFPHGVIDPIKEISEIAQKRGLLMHVDACLGGFMLPFVRELGYEIAEFDFSLPGVTSMSCDLHKYGYAAKGVSAILYRDKKLRRNQFFAYTEWPGGIYGSPTMAGARGGGPIAAAWAVLKYLGWDGYLNLAKKAMDTTEKFKTTVNDTPGLRVLGKPAMTVFSFTSDNFNIYALGDELEKRGWFLDRQQKPSSIHMMISPFHSDVEDLFIKDLRESVDCVKDIKQAQSGMAFVYGMMEAIPNSKDKAKFVYDYMDAKV